MKYLNGFPTLLTDVKNWLRGGYRVMLYCGDDARAVKMTESLSEEYVSTTKLADSLDVQNGVCVLYYII